MTWQRSVASCLRLISLLAILVLLPGKIAAQPSKRVLSQTEPPRNVNFDFVVFNGFLVFFMQAGFIALESGCGRAKNVRNIMLKNTLDVILCALIWWAVGFGAAYGDSTGGFIGGKLFFLDADTETVRPWFYTWTFVLSTVTIPSGCLAERTSMHTYPVITLVITALIHPVVAHWTWAPDSWLLGVSEDCAYLDFAGGGVVHIVGGLTGLIGAFVCGPRLGRFDNGGKPLMGHDMASVNLGMFMLWFGWFGFNCGSTYLYSHPTALVVNRVAMNMTLGASSAGLMSLLLERWRHRTFDLQTLCNGILAGLAASTANVAFFTPWASVVSGILAGATYILSSAILDWLRIDDPLDSSAVHCGSGILGLILSGVLARPAFVESMTGKSCGGLVYSNHGGLQLGLQVLGLCVTVAWTGAIAFMTFTALKYFGWLRVEQSTELAGIDNIEHGGPAYPEFVHNAPPQHAAP